MSKKGITEVDDGMRGSMVINNGLIESSSGSLAGQDHLAQIFQRLLQSGCAEEVLSTGERFKTVTIAFPSHYYTITRRAAKIYVARLAHNSASAEMFVCSSSNTVSENTQAAEQATQADNDEEKPKEDQDEKAHDSDDNESLSSSSIATVKSEQNSDSDEEESPKEEPKIESSALRSDSPVEPPSIESSIQQQQKDLN